VKNLVSLHLRVASILGSRSLVAQVFQPAVSQVFNLRRVETSKRVCCFVGASSFERSADWKGRRYGRLETCATKAVSRC